MRSIKSLVVLSALAVLALAFSAGNAFANVAANTQIVNKATLTYAGGTAESAVVTVTVSLVAAQPTVTLKTGTDAVYTGPNTPTISDTLTVTANANGPATYTIAPSVTNSTNVTSSTPATVNASATNITLGASVTTGNSGTTYIIVPAGLVAGNTVNGIGVGSLIVFTSNGSEHPVTVTGITANATAGTYTISWDSSQALLSTDIPPAGTQVGERKSVSLVVSPGMAQTLGTAITVEVTAAVSLPGASKSVTTTPLNTWTTTVPNVSVRKYVRNVLSPVVGTGAYTPSVAFDGSATLPTYYGVGVIGKTGDILEYVVIATNTGTTDLTGCAISDLIPIAYVTFYPGQYSGSKDVFYIDTNNATSTFTAAGVNVNQASYVASNTPNLIVNAGIGASNSATGTIPAGKSVTIAYQVKIQ
jgi:hypothetical protein